MSTPNPFDYFDAIYCLNLDQETERLRRAWRRYRILGIDDRVQRVAAVRTPRNHHVGCALSWRSVVARADRDGHERILLLEDDAVFLDEALTVLSAATEQIEGIDWDLFYLGGALHGEPTTAMRGRPALRRLRWIACMHAVAVHQRAFGPILAGVPEGGTELNRWIRKWRAIDQFLGDGIETRMFRAVVTSPRIATQIELTTRSGDDHELKARYTI